MTIHFAMVDGRPAFFDTAIHGGNIPAGTCEITPARHAELLDAQADGKELYCDGDGIPRFRTREFSADELRANLTAETKREAAKRIDDVSPLWRQVNDLRADPADLDALARFDAIDAIRAASDAIETVIETTPAAALDGFIVGDRAEWPAQPSQDVT